MNIDNIQSLFKKHHSLKEKKRLRAHLKAVWDDMQRDIDSATVAENTQPQANKNDSTSSTLNPLNELLLTYLLKHDKSLESYAPSQPSTSRVDDIDMADDALVVHPPSTHPVVVEHVTHSKLKNNSNVEDNNNSNNHNNVVDDMDMK